MAEQLPDTDVPDLQRPEAHTEVLPAPAGGSRRQGITAAVAGVGAAAWVVAIRVIAVFFIGLAALLRISEDAQMVAAATATAGVIGSIVGAYFGVKVGSEGKREADAARDEEARKAQQLAAALDRPAAEEVLARFDPRIRPSAQRASRR
jgi:hypothetical protein